MSEFIERSKHPGMTQAVEDHFFGGVSPNTRGMDPHSAGANANDPRPAPAIYPPLGHPGTGVGYRDPSWAGTTPEMVKAYC